MRETLHQQLFICTESLYPEIVGEGRIKTKVLDMNPLKGYKQVQIMLHLRSGSVPLWHRLSIAKEQLHSLVGLLSTSWPGIFEACSHLLLPSMCLLR